MLTATTNYNLLVKNYSKTLASTAAEPTVSRETKYYLANISNVKSANDLLNNSKLYSYVMKAFGLSDMMNAKGLIRKVLEGGVASNKSLANTLNDPRYKALATAFNFAANGAATTQATAAQQGTVEKYVEQTLETDAGKQNPAVQKALYFQRMAPNITSAYSILADKTLLNVVQTALGLSSSMSSEPLDTQAKAITKALKISDLQNPAKLQKFIERYTATYDSQNANTQTTSATSALLVSSPGISFDLLLQLATLKLGGS
ncbi:DUF1217 domain-containing protein [Methylocapsa acidiphila]|uniref:DUF1217 domain-containing protein n=1 Tax=Methylocapsa acidiphila TaxID=133552 RepID=UPI00047E1103|nr:DUF1217 domain-containing protein [Methylocapsa acidiphila]